MKPLILTLFCVLFSLSRGEVVVFLPEYTASLNAWQTLNLAAYTYVATSASEIADFSQKTTIKVANGVVVERSFTQNNNGHITSWDETVPSTGPGDTNPNSIGYHDQGFVPITIDDVYTQCRANILIQDNVANQIFFETDSKGIIKMCGISATACEDDCYRGVQIASIN